jgi:signal transduction histidine kinase
LPPGGRVEVTCLLEGGDEDQPRRVAIHVDDSGPGVSAAVRDRIFEPFFTTKASGSGLGLSIVHAIVAQHGGSISVEEAPAGGARFAIRLPPAPEAG